MVNKPKNIGTKGETKVVRYLQSQGIHAQRRALCGAKDQGDVELPDANCILEVKAGKMTANYGRKLKQDWLNQTIAEQANAKKPGYLVIVVYNRSIENAEVWSVCGHSFWYLDQFAQMLKE